MSMNDIYFDLHYIALCHFSLPHLLFTLPYKAQMEYVHLHSKADTSITGTILLQATPMLKSCHMFNIVDTAFISYERIDCLLISTGFLQGKRK